MKRSGLYIAAMVMTATVLTAVIPVEARADEIEQAVVVESISPVISAENAESVSAGIAAGIAKGQLTAATQIAETAAVAAEEVVNSDAAVRQNLVNYALQFVGGPYRDGGNDPHTGADCSGFVRYVMQHGAGVSMNRSSRAQATQGRAISANEMQPGDLLFYGGSTSSINHVAMYIGDGQIVHASTYQTGIKVSNWNYRAPVKIVSVLS